MGALERGPRGARRAAALSVRAFELIPAIDLLDGRAVRLRQGRYDEVTVYAEDPAALAASFAAQAAVSASAVEQKARAENVAVRAAQEKTSSEAPRRADGSAQKSAPSPSAAHAEKKTHDENLAARASQEKKSSEPSRRAGEGAQKFSASPPSSASPSSTARAEKKSRAENPARLRRLHVVDLDGARSGKPENRAAVRAILGALPGVAVELGGGLRELASVEEWLGLGVERVILGTVALREPALVREAARLFPGRVGVGIDARDGRVAVAGWLEDSDTDALTLARRFEDAGVAAIIHTDIARDGTGRGPNLAASAALARGVALPVVASGGAGSLAHIRAAAACAPLAGLIVGRALLDGSVTLADALEAACC